MSSRRPQIYVTRWSAIYDSPSAVRIDFTVAESLEEANRHFEKRYGKKPGFNFEPGFTRPISETGTLCGYKIVLNKSNHDSELLSEILYEQVFEGEVKSIDGDRIVIEFKVEDDLEDRYFDKNHVKSSWITEGQTVYANCRLEAVPPLPPLSKDGIEKWKSQFKELKDLCRKPNRNDNLSERDPEN